jgi:TonB family protein
MKKTFLLAPLAVALSAMAQTQPNKARVFVSPMTHPGRPITTGPLAYQYQFDRALEREVSKKYTLIPSTTNVATVSQLLKQDGTYWVGGSFTQGIGGYSAYAAKPRHDFPMNEAKNCAAKDTPEQCAAKAFAYVDEIIREDNGWVKPPDTTAKYYTQNVSVFLHYTDGTTRQNLIVTSWADHQEAMVCARIENGSDKWIGSENLGRVFCSPGAKSNMYGDGPWTPSGDFVQRGFGQSASTFSEFSAQMTNAAVQTVMTWAKTNFSDTMLRPIQEGTAKDWDAVLAAQQQYIDALQKGQQELAGNAPAKLAELQKRDQALTEQIANDSAKIQQLERTPIEDKASNLAAVRAMARKNPSGLADLQLQQMDQILQAQNDRTVQISQLHQDRDASSAELAQVQAQEKVEQAIIANPNQTVNAVKPADFPIPGRKIVPPQWMYQQAAQPSPEATAKGIHGTVLLSLTVDDTGHPDNIKVVRGLGYGLDQQAVNGIGGAVFYPAMENGKPIPYDMQVTVAF